jgi:hypothetical protein
MEAFPKNWNRPKLQTMSTFDSAFIQITFEIYWLLVFLEKKILKEN